MTRRYPRQVNFARAARGCPTPAAKAPAFFFMGEQVPRCHGGSIGSAGDQSRLRSGPRWRRLDALRRQAERHHIHGMKTFRVVPRGKKFWVEEIMENGVSRMMVGFNSEAAAARCVSDLVADQRKGGYQA